MKYVRLSEIAEIINGYAFKSSKYVKTGIRIIRIANVQDGYISDEQPCFYPLEYNKNLAKYMLYKDDLLISLTGNVGRVGLLTDDMLPAALNQRVCCIRPKKNDINIKFLYYYFSRKQFIKDCVNASQGVAQLNLSTKWLAAYPIPVLSEKEQESTVNRIEELFSELDAGIETLKKTKAQLEVYRQAVLQKAFSDFTEKISIRNISEFVTSGSRGWAKFYSDIGARFIRITDLTRDSIKLKNDSIQYVDLPENAEGKRSRLKSNDVLVSITADLGSIALITNSIQEAYINQHIAMIRLSNPVQGEFVAWYLKSDYGQKDLLKNKRGGGKLGLGLDDIRDTKIPIVTDEVAFSTVLGINQNFSICDSVETAINDSLLKAEALRQSILKKAFEGSL